LLLRGLIIVLDVAAILGAIALSHLLASHYGPHPEGLQAVGWSTLLRTNPHMPAGAFLACAWIAMLYFTGGYTPQRMNSGARMLGATARSMGGVFLGMLTLQFFVRNQTWSRFLMLAFTGSSATFIGFARLLFLEIQQKVPSTFTPQKVAIVGVGERASQMATRINTYGHESFTLAGFIAPAEGTEMFTVSAAQVLGEAINLNSLVQEHSVELVILATNRLNREEGLVLANRVDQMGLQLLQMPATWGLANPRMALKDLGDLELVDLTTLTYPTRGAWFKRALDLVLVVTGGAVVLPVLMLVSLAIRLADGGPALFTQERCGHGGRRFGMFKFRSMVEGAESMREELEEKNEADGVLFKMQADPRITPIGRYLRRWSIDEFPQVLNVLKGDMNLVGPRPLPWRDLDGIETDSELAYWFAQRSKVKPGITGTWQVSDRQHLKMEDMVRLDIDYIQNWTIWGDVVLLARTLPAIIRGRGSH
jgi:exopolysaccharide biosynthesis polyprenyl glycosylphosphotransferase